MNRGQFAEVSTRADFYDVVKLFDGDTHEVIDLQDAAIQIEIARQTTPPYGSGDTVLRASTDDGSIVVLELGVFDFLFPVEKMRGIAPGNYDLGLTFKRDGRTGEAALGSLAVIDGIVRTSQ